MIEKGAYYSELNNSYVIFICDFDLFGCGRHIYTFSNICEQDCRIRLDDGTTKIFLNAQGTKNDVDQELKAFLNYVGNGEISNDNFVRDLDKAVIKARENKEWRREYMTLYVWQQDIEYEARKRGHSEGLQAGLQEGRQEGLKEGKQEGLKEGLLLVIIAQVRKKYLKQLSPEIIADMLEQDISVITKIYNYIHAFPNDSDEEIYKKICSDERN